MKMLLADCLLLRLQAAELVLELVAEEFDDMVKIDLLLDNGARITCKLRSTFLKYELSESRRLQRTSEQQVAHVSHIAQVSGERVEAMHEEARHYAT